MPIADSVSSRMTPAVPDIFLHVSALQGIDPDNLGLGERLTFDIERDARNGKMKAANVRRPG
jgi:cold shock CspA family protein